MEAVLRVFAESDRKTGGSGKITIDVLVKALQIIDAATFDDKFVNGVFGEGEGLVDFTGFSAWITGNSNFKGFVERPEDEAELDEIDLDTSMVDNMLDKARDKFKELDKNGNGELDAKELKELCLWTFTQFGRSFKSDAEKKKAVDKQVKRFQKQGSVWDYDTFESYYLKQMADVEKFQFKRAEAFQKGYNSSAAAQKFRELDVDSSGTLEGKEIEVFAEWIFKSFHPDGKPLTEEQVKAEAKKLLVRLDDKKGNSDGKLSFTEVDFFIEEKIKQIDDFKKKAAEREAKREQKEKEKQAAKAAKKAEKAAEKNE